MNIEIIATIPTKKLTGWAEIRFLMKDTDFVGAVKEFLDVVNVAEELIVITKLSDQE